MNGLKDSIFFGIKYTKDDQYMITRKSHDTFEVSKANGDSWIYEDTYRVKSFIDAFRKVYGLPTSKEIRENKKRMKSLSK